MVTKGNFYLKMALVIYFVLFLESYAGIKVIRHTLAFKCSVYIMSHKSKMI